MIAEAFPEDGGLFCCTVSNPYGSMNSTAYLTVAAGESHGDDAAAAKLPGRNVRSTGRDEGGLECPVSPRALESNPGAKKTNKKIQK